MDELLMTVKGRDGKVELYYDKIVITRSGFFRMKEKRTEIRVNEIYDIQFVKASGIVNGTITFKTKSGGNNWNKKVWVSSDHEWDFLKLRQKIIELRSEG